MADLVQPNTSTILGIKPVEIQSPLDNAVKALTMKDLLSKSKMQDIQTQQAQQEFNDQQVVRNAYANNVKVDPNGGTSFDQNGMVDEIAKKSPSLLPKINSQILQQKAETLQANMKINDAGLQLLNGVTDAASLQAAKQNAAKMGIPQQSIDQFPDHYDPQLIKAAQAKTLSTKDFLTLQNEDLKTKIAQQEAGNKTKELAIALQKPQQEALQNTTGALISARGQNDISQAYTDRATAKNINSVIGMNKNANDLTPGIVDNVLKLSSQLGGGNGQPMDPTAAQKFAALKEKFTNSPTAANQKAILNEVSKYANTIAGNANQLISTKHNQIIESNSFLAPSDKSNLKTQWVDPYSGSNTSGGVQLNPQAQSGNQSVPQGSAPNNQSSTQSFGPDVLSYAQKHGISPAQAQSIKTQRLMGNK